MLTRCLFALLALAALALLLSPVPGLSSGSEQWLLAAIWLLGTGMAVPWNRWMHLVSPGRNLAFVSKLFGWGAAGAMPLFVITGAWTAVGVCVLLLASALALWKGLIWAAWTWYAVAVASFGLSVTIAIFSLVVPIRIGPLEDPTGAIITYSITVAWTVFWGMIGFVLLRETTAWRRRLRAAAGSTSAS